MIDLQKWEQGDPETVAIRREEATRKGRKYLESLILFGRRTEICGLGRPAGKRCKKYLESE